MPAGVEAPYAPQPTGSGPLFRVLQMQAIVNGVPTLVNVETTMLVDADGRLVYRLQDDVWQQAVLAELQAIRLQLAALTGLPAVSLPAGVGG